MIAPNHALHNLLSVSAARDSEATAIVEPGETRMSYGDLDAYADEIAQALTDCVAEPNRFVALFTRKSADAVAAIFGILKSGNAYIPLSPDLPRTRLSHILADARPSALIANVADLRAAMEMLPADWSLRCIVRQSLALFQAGSSGEIAGEGSAYCLYTSGSSGQPKGVVHTHGSALAFIDWCSDQFSIQASDRFSSCAPLNFDLSIFDIFVAIKHNASIALFEADYVRNPALLSEALHQLAVTIVYATPTLLRLLLNHGGPRRGYSPKLTCFAGEVFPAMQLRSLMDLWPSAEFYNLYGPTETNVCTFHKVTATDLDAGQVPIGRACSGSFLKLLANPEQEDSESGELLVSGASLMAGYCNASQLTTAAFTTIDGVRWYRTGDIVKVVEPGTYCYIGRRDRMIKRRGYRIELDEIEGALARDERLLEVAVVSTASDDGADVALTCFFCAREKVTSLAIRKQLSRLLPLYMMPDSILQIETLPKTSTDKIDYLRLKDFVNAVPI